jgi:hypothetical protein
MPCRRFGRPRRSTRWQTAVHSFSSAVDAAKWNRRLTLFRLTAPSRAAIENATIKIDAAVTHDRLEGGATDRAGPRARVHAPGFSDDKEMLNARARGLAFENEEHHRLGPASNLQQAVAGVIAENFCITDVASQNIHRFVPGLIGQFEN